MNPFDYKQEMSLDQAASKIQRIFRKNCKKNAAPREVKGSKRIVKRVQIPHVQEFCCMDDEERNQIKLMAERQRVKYMQEVIFSKLNKAALKI